MIEIFPVPDLPIFELNDDIAQIIYDLYGQNLKDNDILVIAQKIVSKVEGCEIAYENINPSEFAKQFGMIADKDPRIVEVILNESSSIVRMSKTLLITETHHGFICANAGVDRSNAKNNHVLTLPKNPDQSAQNIRTKLMSLLKVNNLGVLISDTFGRALRVGTTNIAIGVAGIDPLLNYAHKKDLFGYEMMHTTVAVVDELAAAAGLVMGQADEGTPIIVIRGYTKFNKIDNPSSSVLNRKRQEALFW
ncbi:MAG: coenzyme F420-0:L-glutamate ligase [Candidatus Thorarchaeota archaeon]